jgi:4-amino-4-deoxy-L-arabinose transferase-like glycosyltransferase
LGEIPPGFHQDEVSQAYNAFSILETGKDRYGETFPILFRSFGSYQPPVYTYLTSLSIFVFGNTVFAARFTSAFFGILTVILTYFLVRQLVKSKYKENLGLLSAFIVAISPWAIHFSRRVVEGNLGLFFFLMALYLFFVSLKKIKYFLLACLCLGVATHAYYSERLISILFLPFFLIYFRKYYLKYKKWVMYGLSLFGFTLIPHVVTILGGAFASRFDQVANASTNTPLLDFFRHFVSYFSPRYLFSDAGRGLSRVSPNLGVFYVWFFVPFLVGLYMISKMIENRFVKFIGVFIMISLIPVSLTGDVFYPLRALEFFWLLSLVVAIGVFEIGSTIKSGRAKLVIFSGLVIYSLFSFFVSYFALFKYESTENVGLAYADVSRELEKYKNYKVVFDNTRDPAAGLRVAYFKKYDPGEIQRNLRSQLTSPYYSRKVNADSVILDNVVFSPINWAEAACAATIFVGDGLAVSEIQIKDHNLTQIFEIKTSNKDFILRGFSTNSSKQCI